MFDPEHATATVVKPNADKFERSNGYDRLYLNVAKNERTGTWFFYVFVFEPNNPSMGRYGYLADVNGRGYLTQEAALSAGEAALIVHTNLHWAAT